MKLSVFEYNIVVNERNQLSKNRICKKNDIFAHCSVVFWSIQNNKDSIGAGLKNTPLVDTFLSESRDLKI
jgi:hypothetical protein